MRRVREPLPDAKMQAVVVRITVKRVAPSARTDDWVEDGSDIQHQEGAQAYSPPCRDRVMTLVGLEPADGNPKQREEHGGFESNDRKRNRPTSGNAGADLSLILRGEGPQETRYGAGAFWRA